MTLSTDSVASTRSLAPKNFFFFRFPLILGLLRNLTVTGSIRLYYKRTVSENRVGSKYSDILILSFGLVDLDDSDETLQNRQRSEICRATKQHRVTLT
jgi:hypothetical protein